MRLIPVRVVMVTICIVPLLSTIPSVVPVWSGRVGVTVSHSLLGVIPSALPTPPWSLLGRHIIVCTVLAVSVGGKGISGSYLGGWRRKRGLWQGWTAAGVGCVGGEREEGCKHGSVEAGTHQQGMSIQHMCTTCQWPLHCPQVATYCSRSSLTQDQTGVSPVGAQRLTGCT